MGPIDLYSSLCVLNGPYSSFYTCMDSNVSIWVLIGPYSSIWIVMGPYRTMCVLRNSNGS